MDRLKLIRYAKGFDVDNHLLITFERDQLTGEIIIIRKEPIVESEDFFIGIVNSSEDIEIFNNLSEDVVYRAINNSKSTKV